MSEKVIFHVDMNAFFANAELLLNPELEGKCMVVAGQSRRSVVATASYEAREYGIHSGMPVSVATQLCPSLIVVAGNHRFYQKLSSIFVEYLETITPIVEKASIDECYLDVSEVIKSYKKPLDLAMEIQRTLLHKYHLKCSIGVGSTRFLAKMASDMRKPLGITYLDQASLKQHLWSLSIGKMHGIGVKTAPLLENIGILTIGDLAHFKDITLLKTVLGKNAENYILEAQGRGQDYLTTEYEVKSIGQSHTFNEDVVDYDEIKEMFTKLANKIEQRLIKRNLVSDQITITIRSYDFKTIVRSKTIDRYIWEAKDIVEEALSLFDQHLPDTAIRLLGISCRQLREKNDIKEQLRLFE